MSENKMLIDATHPEETRVVVLRNGRVEEFDYESAARRLLRGSIYLAKITRVEPSLQAAFVDYGGNRHGFLAFNEIHPDYYQIPHSDRQALLEEEQAAQRRRNDEEMDFGDDDDVAPGEGSVVEVGHDDDDEVSDIDPEAASIADAADEHDDDPEDTALDVSHLLPPEPEDDTPVAQPQAAQSTDGDAANGADEADAADKSDNSPKPPKTIAASNNDGEKIVSGVIGPDGNPVDAGPDDAVAAGTAEQPVSEIAPAAAEQSVATAVAQSEDTKTDETDADVNDTADVAANEAGPEATAPVEAASAAVVSANADALEELPQRPRRRARSYKIQEVIKRRQIVLIQVVKEERGNKGAALTTYLSLAGRYTVLMPNTARGGGISRKITNLQDRKRLKAIAQELDVPEGMGLIIRTAGASRTKQEIKRDFEYLLRLWENVRDLTLQSTAPSLVYEEGDLIKRSIRDLYSKDIDQIIVAGNDAHREAKSFMRMLMPSHAKNVIKYEDPQPLFARYGIEPQLNAMFSPVVQLRSGGYLVINQTEALVAVDVNSGKATKEFSIEETALKTNLEAAEELSRQLRLRDLAGLIVVDFIDMEEKRNNRAVERKLKDCLRNDRARIQVGRISHFGLLEMSRQRLRTGVLEGSTMQCPHCQGTGTIRSTESVALAVLRSLEDSLMSGQPRSLLATTAPNVAIYLLNHKRGFIQDMEARYGIVIHVQASDAQQGANFTIERLQIAATHEHVRRAQDSGAVSMDTANYNDDEEVAAPATAATAQGGTEEGEERRSRRRRRRRGRRDDREGGERQDARPRGEYEDDTAEAEDDDAEGEVEVVGDERGDDARGDDVRADDEQGEGGRRRSRRRGRRGGRRNREQRAAAEGVAAPGAPQPDITFAEPGDWDDSLPEPATETRERSAVTEPKAQEIETETETVAVAAAETVDAPAASIDEVPANASAETATPPVETQPEPVAAAEEPKAEDVPAPAAPIAAAEAPAPEPKPEEVAPSVTGNGHAAPPAAEAPEVVTPRRSPGASPVAAAPRLERLVMRPDQTGATAEGAAGEGAQEPASQKKGWWQRRFGG